MSLKLKMFFDLNKLCAVRMINARFPLDVLNHIECITYNIKNKIQFSAADSESWK